MRLCIALLAIPIHILVEINNARRKKQAKQKRCSLGGASKQVRPPKKKQSIGGGEEQFRRSAKHWAMEIPACIFGFHCILFYTVDFYWI